MALAASFGKIPGTMSYDISEKKIDIFSAIEDLQQQLNELRQQRCIIKEQERLIEMRLKALQKRLNIASMESIFQVKRNGSPPPIRQPPAPQVPLPPIPQDLSPKNTIYGNQKAAISELHVDQGTRRWFDRKLSRKGSKESVQPRN